jgi:hypothetical protein
MVAPQVSAVGAAHNIGDPIPKTILVEDTTVTGGAAAPIDPMVEMSSSLPKWSGGHLTR